MPCSSVWRPPPSRADAVGAAAAAPGAAGSSPAPARDGHCRGLPASRPGGAGPLYWSTYDYENVTNTLIPEAVWKANVDWVAETFRDYGYTMVCTDGWIDHTQKITPHGYIVSQADDWEHDWAWWATYLKAKGCSSASTTTPCGPPSPRSRIRP